MKDFSNNNYRIANSPVEVRLAYTGFLLLVLLGYLSIWLIAAWRIGPGFHDIIVHYRGSDLVETAFPRSSGQMLDDLHFHVFMQAIVLLILTHLVLATSLTTTVKARVIVLAYGAAFTDLVSPWLIRFVAGEFAWLQVAGWIGMSFSAFVMIGAPLYEMWFRGGQ